LSGYILDKPREYSPFPQPNSSTKGLSFLKNDATHLPFRSNFPLRISSREGWITFSKVSFSLNRLSLFLLPKTKILAKVIKIAAQIPIYRNYIPMTPVHEHCKLLVFKTPKVIHYRFQSLSYLHHPSKP